MKFRMLCLLLLLTSLSACDLLGIPDPAKEAERKDAEGKAIGGACRQAGQALEDCFVLNPNAPKASIFAGWKDMNDYMTQNKLEIVKPQIAPTGAKQQAPADGANSGASADDAADSSTDKDSAPASASSATRKGGSKKKSSSAD